MRFYKRSQILVADLWACFQGEGYGKFNDIDTLTMFAGERIFRNLVKVLPAYSDRLSDTPDIIYYGLLDLQSTSRISYPGIESYRKRSFLGAAIARL